MLSGGGDCSDWVKNLHQPERDRRDHQRRLQTQARVIETSEEDELARDLLVEKYERTPGSLSNWRARALSVAEWRAFNAQADG